MTKPRHIPDKLTRDSELVICPCCCCFFLVSSCSLYNHKMNLFSFSRDWQVKTSCSSGGRTGGWLLLLRRVEFDLQNKPLKKFLFTCFSPVRLVLFLPLKPFLWPNCSLGHVLENSAKCSKKANSPPPPSPRPTATMEKCPFRTQSVIEIFACKTEIKFNYGCRLSLLIKRQRTRIFSSGLQ